jgi:protein-disulfide isomerase
VAVLIVAVVAGVVVQSGRSPSGATVVKPAHALGPNGGEQRGSASAPVLVEEYGDFQCPHCADFQRTVGPTVDKLVDSGKIRFVFHPIAFGTFSTGKLLAIGREVGLTDQRFTTAVRQGTYENWIAQQTDEASRRGVNQTPTVLVDGQMVPGAITPQGLQAAVDAALAAK